MGETSGQTAPMAPVPLQAIPAPAPATIPAPASLGVIQEGPQAAPAVGNRVVEDRVMQQLRWLERLVFVCIFLALYAVMKN